ncbi:PR-5-like protein, partial [Aphelenchoides avenae]
PGPQGGRAERAEAGEERQDRSRLHRRTKFRTDLYCCAGAHDKPETCKASDWLVDYYADEEDMSDGVGNRKSESRQFART